MPKRKVKLKRRRRIRGGFYFKNSQGVEYEVIFRKPDEKAYDGADGVCFSPDDERPRIYISPYLTNQGELNTIIHEFCHAFFWEASEREVYGLAGALSRFLYNKQRWRKKDK